MNRRDDRMDYIALDEGEYSADRAFLINSDQSAVAVEAAVIRVFLDQQGNRRVNGRGFVYNLRMVELLEAGDELDLILDLGNEFKYLLKTPDLKAGKVFSPDVKSVLQVFPRSPLEQIPESEFETLLLQLEIL